MAVIPIFVNAGAAVLPTVLAAVASVAMVALKPRELAHLLRRRPLAVGLPAGVIVIGLGLAVWFLTSGSPRHAVKRSPAGATVHHDWAKVAETLIAQQQVRQKGMVGAGPVTENRGQKTEDGGQKAVPSFVLRPPSSALFLLWSFRPEDTMFLSSPAVAGRSHLCGRLSDGPRRLYGLAGVPG